jgi:hypothetical protein
MAQIKKIFEDLLVEFQNKFTSPFAIHWHPIGQTLKSEYTLSFSGGILSVKAEGYPGAIEALKSMDVGIKSGHLLDFLGSIESKSELRPLWIETRDLSLLTASENAYLFCKKVWQLGYNAVLINETPEVDFHLIIQNLKHFDLKIIFKPSLNEEALELTSCPLNKNFNVFLEKKIQYWTSLNFDYLFWESRWQNPDFTKDAKAESFTISEIVLNEVQLLENSLTTQKLLFYIPSNEESTAEQSAKWILNLLEELSHSTTLVFSALAGNFKKDYLPLHPLWNKLRERKVSTFLPLMPIFNIGLIQSGEGLWPIIIEDLMNDLIRSKNLCFGVICAVSDLPSDSGIQECNLWLASQMMWRSVPSNLLIESWFEAYRPEWKYVLLKPFFDQIRHLTKGLQKLRFLTNESNRDAFSNQECKLFSEYLVLQLIEIKNYIDKKPQISSKNPNLNDYFNYFLNDAKKILLHASQCYSFTLTHLFNESEIKDSFWIDLSSASLGMRSGTKVTFLSVPNKGIPGSAMHAIYKENRLFN